MKIRFKFMLIVLLASVGRVDSSDVDGIKIPEMGEPHGSVISPDIGPKRVPPGPVKTPTREEGGDEDASTQKCRNAHEDGS